MQFKGYCPKSGYSVYLSDEASVKMLLIGIYCICDFAFFLQKLEEKKKADSMNPVIFLAWNHQGGKKAYY